MAQDTGKQVHPMVPELLDQVKKGEMTRREFVRTAAVLGVTAGAAYGMVGMRPRPAAAQTKKMGGHLRVGMNVMEITDPATFDWTEKGNGARQITEALVRIGNDNVARPYLAEGWTASESGIPQAFLQIDVPDSVKLEGKMLTEFRDLAKNEYVREPFERLIDPGRTKIGFTLISEPESGDSLSLNIIAYIKSEDGDDNYYLRRRDRKSVV